MLRRALILCALFSPLPAFAGGEPELPSLSIPGQWNYVTQEDATSTSRCIGRPTSPLCAVETLLTCFQRNRLELCRLVDDGAEQYAQVFSAPADPGKYLAYRIIAASRKGPDVTIRLDQREGEMGRYAKATGAPMQDFLLRKQADGSWKIVNWGDPGE